MSLLKLERPVTFCVYSAGNDELFDRAPNHDMVLEKRIFGYKEIQN